MAIAEEGIDECKYGKLESWIRFLNDDGKWGNWENTTVHANLTVHQPFQVKATVYVKKNCYDLYMRIYEISKTYEVVDGPSKIGEEVYFSNVTEGDIHTMVWTVRPSGKWTGGISPLNIWCQFTKYLPRIDRIDYEDIDYTLIAAYIFPQEWNGNYNNDYQVSSNTHKITGFEISGIILAIFMAYIIAKRK